MRSLLAQRFSLLIRSSCLANTTVPKAGAAFKSLIFIALNPKGPNLPFRGVNEYSDDSLEEDVDSSKSTDSESDGDEPAEEPADAVCWSLLCSD